MSIGNLGWEIFPFIVWWYIWVSHPKNIRTKSAPKKLDMDILFA